MISSLSNKRPAELITKSISDFSDNDNMQKIMAIPHVTPTPDFSIK